MRKEVLPECAAMHGNQKMKIVPPIEDFFTPLGGGNQTCWFRVQRCIRIKRSLIICEVKCGFFSSCKVRGYKEGGAAYKCIYAQKTRNEHKFSNFG